MHHLFPSWKKAWTNSVICLTHGIPYLHLVSRPCRIQEHYYQVGLYRSVGQISRCHSVFGTRISKFVTYWILQLISIFYVILWLTNSTCVVVFFQSSAFKIAIELINADAAKNGSKIKFSMDFKSEFLFPFLIRNWLKAGMNENLT